MPVYHRSQRLQIIDEKVDVTQLFGDRYRIVVRCRAAHGTEAWYEANKDEIFADFGTLYNAQMAVDGIDARVGEAYPNMALVSNAAGVGRDGEYTVQFVYETLTSAWAQEQEDQVDSTENGLRFLTRSQVAAIDTAAPYDEDDVGVVTITDEGKTLYLAGLQDETKTEPDAQIGRFLTRWAEAGILSQSFRQMSEGVQAVTTEFLALRGTTLGPTYSENVGNYEGLKTITVVNLQDNQGQSIIGTGENRVDQYERKSEFTYPGTVQPEWDELQGPNDDSIDPVLVNFVLDPPVQAKIDATVSVIFQESSDIADSDETYNDGKDVDDDNPDGTPAKGYWNPTKWATTYIAGIGHNYSPFSETQGLRGYRADMNFTDTRPDIGDDPDDPDVPDVDTVTLLRNGVLIFQPVKENYITGYLRLVTTDDEDESGNKILPDYDQNRAPLIRMNGVSDSRGRKFLCNGRRIYGYTTFIAEASGGPENPIGNKYVLDIDIRPAFEDIDGNKYYKKTIVTATIPDNA